MKHNASKHRQPWARTAVYSFMTLTVVTIVALLMLVVSGYSFNEKDGRLEQGGLLQFRSIPTGATVILDEMKLGSETDSKTTVVAGSHSVQYDKAGYRSWKKTVNVKPGKIAWLSYARLIPNNIEPQTLRKFTTLAGAQASPNRNYMLLQESVTEPTFVLADIRGDTLEYSDIVLPSTILTPNPAGKNHGFAIEKWSANEQAVLIRHMYDDDKTEWILLDREEPEKSINLSTMFAITPTKIQFAGGSDKLFFVQIDDVVRRINLDEETLSRPLVSNVAYFNRYDDKTIVYATKPDMNNKRIVGYASVDIERPVPFGTYPADDQPLFVDMGSYFSKRYVAVLHGQELKITSGRVPTLEDDGTLKLFKKQTVPAGALSMTVSRNGRFFVTQLPDGYATYDIDLKKYDRTTWSVSPTVQRELRWLDDYMIWTDTGDQLRFYEFDGANQNNIMPVAEGFGVTLTPNNKWVYGIGRTDDGLELKRAQLVL